VFLAFDIAVSRVAGVVALLVAITAYVVVWVVIPLRARPQVSRR